MNVNAPGQEGILMPCKYEKCLRGGKHWANPWAEGEPSMVNCLNGVQMYCSIECSVYDKAEKEKE